MTTRRILIMTGILAVAVAAIVGFGWSQGPPVDFDPANYKDGNDRLKEIEDEVPGFGGVFLSDEQSVLNIYLTENENDSSTQEKAREEVEEWFDIKSGLRLNIIKGEYTITQLADWIDAAEAGGLWDQTGVTMLDLREGSNEIFIGVVDQANVEPVYAFTEGLDIPRGAVTVGVVNRPRNQSHYLTDRAHDDKMAGGYQVDFGYGACTMGFVTIKGGTAGMVTAGHCTESGVYDGGVASANNVHQSSSSNLIGFENVDPSFSTGLSGCQDSDGCRHSDSAFVRFSSGVQYNRGWVAKPSSWWGVSVDPDTAHYSITSDSGAFAEGDEVVKVGKRTGRTKGDITNTCFKSDDLSNTEWKGTYLCQTQVDVRSRRGDSGAPVFKVGSDDNVTLVGILTHGDAATYYDFSPLGRIYLDLGSTSETWDTCTSGC